MKTFQPYVNQSASSVHKKFSLHRTYIIFRSMGMRHLPVVDSGNHVIGVLTRKDLMGFSLEERVVHRHRHQEKSDEPGYVNAALEDDTGTTIPIDPQDHMMY
uniref:CBS domain-containing protein n=1 Tax=Branchiostoma floridae TaxID=7739 RepID=C3XW95_BRAFL|eukprot:XP_002611619.1 hypothetical protein BRAFLDRAFT_63732 [Branchiostoma floridae]